MQDNLLGGRIFVENDSVREVFEQNMPDLASAFLESGMEMGSMNVSVGNGRTQENEERRLASEKAGRAEKEAVVSLVGSSAYYFASHAINLMA
jgi:flagellar hook-length control protein FliK